MDAFAYLQLDAWRTAALATTESNQITANAPFVHNQQIFFPRSVSNKPNRLKCSFRERIEGSTVRLKLL